MWRQDAVAFDARGEERAVDRAPVQAGDVGGDRESLGQPGVQVSPVAVVQEAVVSDGTCPLAGEAFEPGRLLGQQLGVPLRSVERVRMKTEFDATANTERVEGREVVAGQWMEEIGDRQAVEQVELHLVALEVCLVVVAGHDDRSWRTARKERRQHASGCSGDGVRKRCSEAVGRTVPRPGRVQLMLEEVVRALAGDAPTHLVRSIARAGRVTLAKAPEVELQVGADEDDRARSHAEGEPDRVVAVESNRCSWPREVDVGSKGPQRRPVGRQKGG